MSRTSREPVEFTEAGPSIASLIENMSGPTGGWRVQIAAVKSEDVAKSTWARLQSAHGGVLANLRMLAARVALGDKGVGYRAKRLRHPEGASRRLRHGPACSMR